MGKTNNIIILLMVISISAFGQFRPETLRRADKLLENHKFYEAIEHYKQAFIEAPYLQEIAYKIASLYKKNNATEQAKKWYEEVLKFKTQDYVLAKFEYAIVLKRLGKYEKAISTFEEFIKYYNGDDKADISKVVDRQIKGCDRAMMSENDTSFEVINLSEINSSYTDISPLIFQDSLYFSSIKTDTPLTYLDDIGIKVQMNLQKVGFDSVEDTLKGEAKTYGPERLLGDNSHYGGAVFTAGGQIMLFTKCTTDEGFKNHCDIYGAKKLQSNKWSEPIKLGPTVNDEFGFASSTHPCIAPHRKKNKNVLYFSSNKTGGQGGYDLWTVDIDHNFVCSRAKNLGRKINSPGDEITPSYSENQQTFYFSSNGQIGFGGFDVFRVKKEGQRFKTPSALEGPFNTSSDDFFFQNYEKDKYVIASNREGAKKYHNQYVLDDIFIIKKIQSKKYLIARVFLKDSLLTEVDSAQIQMVSIDTSRFINNSELARVFTEQDYTLSTNIDGFINDSKTVSISEASRDTIIVNLSVSKVQKEQEIQLKNIYFAFNSDSLTDSSKIEINLLHTILINNPQFKIEIGAHTDDVGKDEANKELSQRRAESVVKYLISKDISKKRLIAAGYGESTPIAPNKNSDGSDSNEGRRLNRRIVFKIIGIVEDEKKEITKIPPPTNIPKNIFKVYIGKYLNKLDSSIFSKIGKVNFTLDKDSLYKHFIGNYSTNDSAVAAKQQIASLGYEDAYVIQEGGVEIREIKHETSESTTTTDRILVTTIGADSTAIDSTVIIKDSTMNHSPEDSLQIEHEISVDSIAIDSVLTSPSTEIEEAEEEVMKKIFISQPIDGSPVKNKVSWLKRPSAQRISCSSSIRIDYLTIMAKEKVGITFKIRVVKASNGKLISETEEFTLAANKKVSASLMKLFQVKTNIELEEGSYFIFPIVTKGSLAFMPRFTKENSFEEGKVIIHKAMYTSYDNSTPTKYKFKTKEEKKNTYINYGPFLKISLELLPEVK
jgi:OOP family OmpA-OmpF porin